MEMALIFGQVKLSKFDGILKTQTYIVYRMPLKSDYKCRFGRYTKKNLVFGVPSTNRRYPPRKNTRQIFEMGDTQ